MIISVPVATGSIVNLNVNTETAQILRNVVPYNPRSSNYFTLNIIGQAAGQIVNCRD